MLNCAVKCKNSIKKYIETIKFFRFSKDEIISDIWVKTCGNPNVSKQVCKNFVFL